MPQGGIFKKEKIKRAALRELREEVGTKNVEILAKSANWLTYDLPDKLVGEALGGKFRGHRYRWIAMRFLGADDEIDISNKNGYPAEFDEWRWVELDEVVDLGFSFRREVYEQVVNEFGQYATVSPETRNHKKIFDRIRSDFFSSNYRLFASNMSQQ